MIIPVMVTTNLLILLGILRFSNAWTIIKELNSVPKFSPILMVVVVQFLFTIIMLTLGAP